MLYLTRFDFVLYHYLDKFIRKPDILSQKLDYSNSSYDNKNIVLIKLYFLIICTIEDLTFEEEEYSLLIDIHWDNWASLQEELVAYIARELLLLFSKLI